MATGALVNNGLESSNGVLPVDGLCSPIGGLLDQDSNMPVSRQRYAMATLAGGEILCDQLDGTICRVKNAACASPERRLTAL